MKNTCAAEADLGWRILGIAQQGNAACGAGGGGWSELQIDAGGLPSLQSERESGASYSESCSAHRSLRNCHRGSTGVTDAHGLRAGGTNFHIAKSYIAWAY